MGYSIYFSQKRPFTTQEWGDIRAAAINMFNRLKQIKGGDGTGRPVIDNDSIIFNGDASKGEDHETMVLDRKGGGFQFCKTARKPYDRYVKAILCVANFYAPGALEVSCDGDDEDDCWNEGVRIANIYVSKCGRFACSPLVSKELEAAQPLDLPSQASVDRSEELDRALAALSGITDALKNESMQFLVNYLKANIDDVKEARG